MTGGRLIGRCTTAATALVLAVLLAACSSGGPGYGVASDESVSAGTSSTTGSGQTLRVVADLPEPAPGATGSSELIVPSDVLSVKIFQIPDLNSDVAVDASGNVTLPLVGDVPAAGKSLTQLAADLKKVYGQKYLQNPQITVAMKESAGQRVTLDGEFQKAGIYPTTAGMSLLQAIAVAGNFTGVGDQSKVYVYRKYQGQQLVANYNVEQIREGKRANPRIYGGDVIVAFPSGIKVVESNLAQALGIATSATILF